MGHLPHLQFPHRGNVILLPYFPISWSLLLAASCHVVDHRCSSNNSSSPLLNGWMCIAQTSTKSVFRVGDLDPVVVLYGILHIRIRWVHPAPWALNLFLSYVNEEIHHALCIDVFYVCSDAVNPVGQNMYFVTLSVSKRYGGSGSCQSPPSLRPPLLLTLW